MAITASQVKELREKTGVGMMECKKALSENDGDMEKAILWLRERGLSRAAKKAGRVAAEGIVEVLVNDAADAGVLVELNCETDFVTKNTEFMDFAQQAAKLALDKKVTDVEEFKKTTMADGQTVEDALTALIAKIGENMTLRRVAVVSVQGGTVVGYSHMGGKIGALVALANATGAEAVELGKDVAMHVAAVHPKYLDRSAVDTSELEQEKEIATKKLQEEGKPENMIGKIVEGQMNKYYKEVCLVDQPFVKEPKTSVAQHVASVIKGAEVVSFARFQLGEGIEKKEENFAEEVKAQLK